jgi:hypothetical protein
MAAATPLVAVMTSREVHSKDTLPHNLINGGVLLKEMGP